MYSPKLGKYDTYFNRYYIVLLNIMQRAEPWEDTVRVRKLMRDRGVKKTPGWSSITVDGIIHEFVAGDEIRPGGDI